MTNNINLILKKKKELNWLQFKQMSHDINVKYRCSPLLYIPNIYKTFILLSIHPQ